MLVSRRPRKGTVVLLVAACSIVLLGSLALVVDGGLLQDDQKRAQSAADAATLAGANILFQKWQAFGGDDGDGGAKSAATVSAAKNGFSNCDVFIPPTTGPYKGLKGYIEVIVTSSTKRSFSKIWGAGDLPVSARAVAQGRWADIKAGIMVLNPTKPGALTNTGSGSLKVEGVPIIVNSNAPDAATATGGGICTAPEFHIVGTPGISGSGIWRGEIVNGQNPIPDPLAYLPEPDPTQMVVQSKNPTHISGTKTEVLQPGVYKGGITVSGQGSVIMLPGIYYMDGGGFTFTGQGSMQASGVMVVNAPSSNSANISINGTGSISFSPPTEGIYRGISLWQTRSSENTLYVSGNGGSSMSGTFYAARGTLNVTGNGTNNVIGSQYISYNVEMGGNGAFSVDWTTDMSARTRIITLVE